MKKKKMLFILIALGLIAASVSVFSFYTFQKRYSEVETDENVEVTKEIQPEPDDDSETIDSGSVDEADIDGLEEEISDEEYLQDDGDIEPVEITGEDCDNKCDDFNEAEEDFMYCLEICGLADSENSDDCMKLSGITQDYCWKAQAVESSDFKLCDKISDAGVKKTCKNRVTEDLVEP
jgi:hypothetical protein